MARRFSSNDLFMHAANRYRPRPGEPAAGVQSWAGVNDVVDAIESGQADPFNNYYDENHFDDSGRSEEEANRSYTHGQFAALESYTRRVGFGARLYIRQDRNENFSSPKEVNQRVKDAHAVGSILQILVAAAKEMTEGVRDGAKGVVDGFEFERLNSRRIEELYVENKAIMQRVVFSLDAIVDFVITEHNRETKMLLREPHRRAIRNLARIGRKAIGLNGGNGHGAQVPIC